MNQRFFEITLAFFVGLIPFLLKIYFDNKQYKRGQLDRLSTTLFDRQVDALISIQKLIVSYYKTIQTALDLFIGNDDIVFSYHTNIEILKKNEIDYNPIRSLSEKRREFYENIQKYELLIPNKFLELLIKYEDLVDQVYYSILHDFKDVPNEEIRIFKTKGELVSLTEDLEETYISILASFKSYIGTEYLSKNSWNYVINKDTMGKIIHRYTKTIIK